MFKFLILALVVASCSSPKKSAEPDREVASGPVIAPGQRTVKINGLDVPLNNAEVVPPEEAGAIDDINRIMIGFFKKQYPGNGVTKDPATGLEFKGTRRGVHPRGHGCVAAKMIVRPDLKNPVGIFQPGAKYDATIRFSNGSPALTGNDRDVDTRGFAMKVHNVPGVHVLGNTFVQPGENMSQDFTLNSSEPFFADTAVHYRDFMDILSFKSASLEDAGKKFVLHLGEEIITNNKKSMVNAGEIAFRVTKAFQRIKHTQATNPLGIPYWSITAFQHGSSPDSEIVKYKVIPCHGPWQESIDPNDKFYLRTNLIKYLASKPACFRFQIQHQTKEYMSVEDPTVSWTENDAPFEDVAQIEIPQQHLIDDMTCEKIVINPWNSLPEHKPVGAINRIRLPTYMLSVQKRRQTNRY